MKRRTVYLSEFKKESDSMTFAVAMDYLKENPYTTLVVEPGTYTLTDALAGDTASDHGR